jgi:hypothetical protein
MGNRNYCSNVLTIALILSLTATGRAQQAADTSAWPFTRMHGGDPEIRRLVREATSRSKTFTALLHEVQQSNGIVFVSYGQCAKGQIRSCVTGVQGDERERAIRIVVDSRTTDFRLMATIAHELQHAVEILHEPSAIDGPTTMVLYRRIGSGRCKQGLSDRCETELALATERTVLEELYRTPPASRPR